MSDQNKPFELHDILAAFSLLSRIPVPVDHNRAGERAANAAWAYPLVGLALGFGVGILAMFIGWLGLPNGMVSAVVLLALVMATGAMHEDGLADFADGIWGGNTPERRLEIMKDSRIGAYGALALIIFLLARHSGISTLSGWDLPLTLAAIGAASRGLMVGVMFMLDPAKPKGLSASIGQPGAQTTLIALAIGGAACVLLTGFSGLVLFAAMALAVMAIGAIAAKKLGGQTGDVLGMAQQAAELIGLAAAITLL